MSLKSNIQKKSIKRKQKGGAKGGSFVLAYDPKVEEYMHVVKSDEGIEDATAVAVVAAAANSKKTLNGVESLILAVAKQQKMLNEWDYEAPAAAPASVAAAAPAAADAAIDDGSDAAAPAAAAPTVKGLHRNAEETYKKIYREDFVSTDYNLVLEFEGKKFATTCEEGPSGMFGFGKCNPKKVKMEIMKKGEELYILRMPDTLTTGRAEPFDEIKVVQKDVQKKNTSIYEFHNKGRLVLNFINPSPEFETFFKGNDSPIDMEQIINNYQARNLYNELYEKQKSTSRGGRDIVLGDRLKEGFSLFNKSQILTKLSFIEKLKYQNDNYIVVKNNSKNEVYFVDTNKEMAYGPLVIDLPPKEPAPASATTKVLPSNLNPRHLLGLEGEDGGRKSSKGSRKARTKVFKGSKKVNRA